MVSVNLLAFLILIVKVKGSNDVTWESCTSYISQAEPGNNQRTYCNEPALGAIAHCIRQLPSSILAEQSFIESCDKYNLTSISFQDAYENANQGVIDQRQIINNEQIDNTPIIISRGELSHAPAGNFINHNLAAWLGIGLISYWFIIILTTGIIRGLYFIFPKFVNKFTGKFINYLRKYIFLPALHNKNHIQQKRYGKYLVWSLPTRWEAIMVIVWIIMAIVFVAVDVETIESNHNWPNKPKNFTSAISSRAGMMVVFIIPQLILFAGRNNFLQWLSGWSYSRFLYVHKWLARTAMFLVLIHAVSITISDGGLHSMKYRLMDGQAYMIGAYFAIISGFTLITQATFSIRRINYEIFLIIHQILALSFIVGGWVHTTYRGYQPWFYAAAAIWGFDRLVRIARLLFFGIRPAIVQSIGDETIKVSIPISKYWKPFPGCHAYIHFLKGSYFWQSHPFSLIETVEDDGAKTITFYLKIKGGMTHGLFKFLKNEPEKKAVINVMIEGPYGQRHPFNRFSNAVFFTGGNGIPGLYYEAFNIIKNNTSRTKVKLYWTIRHYKSIEWFYPELLKLKNTSIDVIVYITQPQLELSNPIADSDSSIDDKYSDKELIGNSIMLRNKLSFIEFREGRPNINQLVQLEIKDTDGSISFATCGHGAMVDDIRRSIAENLNLTSHRIDLYEENQSW